MMTFIMVLDSVLGIVMLGFTGWNWFLACYGNTTIEFFTANMPSRGKGSRKPHPLSFNSIDDNIYRVFGTQKFFRVLSPSLRNVPFTGLEWSFMFKDMGLDIDGYPVNTATSDLETQ